MENRKTKQLAPNMDACFSVGVYTLRVVSVHSLISHSEQLAHSRDEYAGCILCFSGMRQGCIVFCTCFMPHVHIPARGQGPPF
jgi:hypothetical protein